MIRAIAIFAVSASLLPAQGPVTRAWEMLASGAAEKSAETRAKATQALGLIRDDAKARQMAETALADENHEVRAAAAAALGRMGAARSIAKLREALIDKEPEVILAAANALLILKDNTAYEVYYAVLSGEMKNGRGFRASQMKTLKDPKALALLGFEQGIGFIPFAGVGYQVLRILTKDDASPVRAAAALRLATDPDPKSKEALATAITDKKWIVRAAVLDAIARRNDPTLSAAAVAALDDENDTVRYNAAAAVIRLSKAKSRPVVSPAAKTGPSR
jgi:HEAT repeat protein